MQDRGAIEADICTVFFYQCRVKEKIITKKPKAQSPKNLVIFTYTEVLVQLIQQLDRVPQQEVKYPLEKYHSDTDSIYGIYR